MEMKFICDEVATALAIIVFEQPGGPYNKIPLGGLIANLSSIFFFLQGHSTLCLSNNLTSSYPPISVHLVYGIST